MNRNSLSTDQELHVGEHLMSMNGEYKAVLQADGNFVIYKWSPVWDTETKDKDSFRLLLQSDNNLVIYNKSGVAHWATGTFSQHHAARMRLTLRDDGKLVLLREGEEIWSS